MGAYRFPANCFCSGGGMKGRFEAVNTWLHPFFLYFFCLFSLYCTGNWSTPAWMNWEGWERRVGGCCWRRDTSIPHVWGDAGLGGCPPLSMLGKMCKMPPKTLTWRTSTGWSQWLVGMGLFGLRERLIRAAQGPQKTDLTAAARVRSWRRETGVDIPPNMGTCSACDC